MSNFANCSSEIYNPEERYQLCMMIDEMLLKNWLDHGQPPLVARYQIYFGQYSAILGEI